MNSFFCGLDNNNSDKINILFEPQLDLATNQAQPDNDCLDVSTKTLWYLARKKDMFAPLILWLLKEDTCYHKDILLAEYEDWNGYLYFWNQCYIP